MSSAVKPAGEVTKNLATGTVSLKVHYYEWVKCWYTNTRDSTIKVTKVLAPATDSGKFNLLIDGAGQGHRRRRRRHHRRADGPARHPHGGRVGRHGDRPGQLRLRRTSCVDKAHAAKPADTDGSVQVATGDQWECVITNTRKSHAPAAAGAADHDPPTEHAAGRPGRQPADPRQPRTRAPGQRASCSGPTGCPTTTAVAASVSGRRIVKVTFYVDGKKVKTLTKANRNGRWVLPMNVKRFAFGTHRVRVTVQFAKSSQTKAKTLRLSFNRCHSAVVKPQFTG